MKIEEAEKIFKEWQYYQEINDKLSKIFHSIPESFLPYPSDVLEEALNIIAKMHFDLGDVETSKTIQTTISSLIFYKKDEEAIEDMEKLLKLLLENPELKEAYLKNLKEAKDSWAKLSYKK